MILNASVINFKIYSVRTQDLNTNADLYKNLAGAVQTQLRTIT